MLENGDIEETLLLTGDIVEATSEEDTAEFPQDLDAVISIVNMVLSFLDENLEQNIGMISLNDVRTNHICCS